MKHLLVPIDDADLALVADYAAALGLPSIDAAAARIVAEWAGRQRIKQAARKRRR